MPPVVRTELTLPGEPRLLRLVQDYVLALGDLAALPEDQAKSLAQAVWEACSNCIEHDFEDDEAGAFKVVGEVTPGALTISIRDRGLPFDQTPEPAPPPPDPENPGPACLRDRGLSLIHQAADEVRWLNHGWEGKELRLTKYLSGVCRLEPHPAAASGLHHETTHEGPSQDYAIRRQRPEDSIQMARLMYRVYGYSYSDEDFYYPDHLAHDVETGKLAGVVAVAENGEIVGHVGVKREDLGPLAELGQMVVAPAHRGQGLRRVMGDRLQEEIRRLGLAGLFGEAVTIHTLSQEASENRGLHVCGVQLLDWQADFKKLRGSQPSPGVEAPGPESAPPRETMVFYFKYLLTPERTVICPPSRHREMLASLYGNLGVNPEFLEPYGPTGRGRLEVHFDPAAGLGLIQVNRIGMDTLPEIYQARLDLCRLAGAPVVALHLPLAQGPTPYVCAAAEEDGFFFSGLRPFSAQDGDFLRLQYLNAPLDPERIHLFSPVARDLLAYILRERDRVGQTC